MDVEFLPADLALPVEVSRLLLTAAAGALPLDVLTAADVARVDLSLPAGAPDTLAFFAGISSAAAPPTALFFGAAESALRSERMGDQGNIRLTGR